MHHREVEGLTLPCTTAASPLLEALVVVQLDDLRGRYVQVLVDLAREVLVEQRLELAVLLLQLGDLVGVGPGVGLGLGLGLGLRLGC